MKKFLFCICMLSFLFSCGDSEKAKELKEPVAVPSFDGNKAFSFVEKQCSFGPRVPGSEAHSLCADFLCEILKQNSDTLFVQDFRSRIFDGSIKQGKNIIASFNPMAKKRLIVAAHWDSRPFADHDSIEERRHQPIDGANDGASGVGIILEIAQVVHQNPLPENVGLDLILFDLEDYGSPSWNPQQYNDNSWALGSQHWAKYPHRAGYHAYLGILLDMVGNENPRFPREYYSDKFASNVLNKVWNAANSLGYSNIFVEEDGDPINDDHIAMNTIAGIPTIDIIHLEETTNEHTFYHTWHTSHDNIQSICPSTLQVVGDVVLHVIYNER